MKNITKSVGRNEDFTFEKLVEENKYLRHILNLKADIIFSFDPETDIWNMERIQRQRGTDLIVDTVFDIRNIDARKKVHEADIDKYDEFVDAMRRGENLIEGSFRLKEYGNHWLHKDVKALTIDIKGKKLAIGCVKNTSVASFHEIPEVDKRSKDPLTNVLNKMSTTDLITDMLGRGEKGAFLVLDVDNFKMVNDSQGHLFGDEVLANVARAICSAFRFDDVVGRVGGDEFVIFMRNTIDENEIQSKAQKLCEAIAAIYVGEDANFSITASIGASLSPRDGVDFNELFDKADNAMYYTKNNGKAGCTIYDANNQEIACGGRSQKRHIVPRSEYTTFERADGTVNKFAYELADFTFQLMEDTADMDSAINLLLRKVKLHYELYEVNIFGINQKPACLECMYQITENKLQTELYRIKNYPKTDWDNMLDQFSRGYIEELKQHEDDGKVYSHLKVPMYAEKRFVGYLEIIKKGDAYIYNESEKNIFKAFARILSAYALSARAYAETSKMVEKMNEVDALTGLYKYDNFKEKVIKAIENMPEDKKIMFVYSDISHFKIVNEGYGYAVGDAMLKTFARFVDNKQDSNIACARVYSDNFINAIYIDKSRTNEQLVDIISKKNAEIEGQLQQRFFNSKILVNTGISIIENKDEDVETAVTNANYARKEAKRNKGMSVMMFDNSILEEIRKDAQLTSYLPKALKNKEICVYYQPKTECGSTNVIGAEALVRWIKPNGKMIYPDEFIPIFEKNGAIVEVDYYVYDCVFRYLADRIKNGKFVVPISVNVSRVHLETTGFFDYMQSLFDKYKVPARFLEFEITEGIYIKDMEKVLKFNAELKKLGTKVSMDDFGSGYSSLTLLNNLPIDVLKIDKSLMRNKILTESDEVIVESVVNMAKKLNMQVLCEGVETEEQCKFLSKVGCDIVQGYFYARPMPQTEFDQYIEAHQIAKADQIRFAFDNNLYDDTGTYQGLIIGGNVAYADGPVEGMKSLRFEGGMPGRDLLEIPTEVLSSRSYSISMWLNEEDKRLWTSAVYTTYEDGFTSILPRGWQMKGSFRMKKEDGSDEWFDAGMQMELLPGWNHVVATFDAVEKKGKLFINGSRAGIAENVPDLYVVRRILIGGDIYQNGFKGRIADLRFYNAPLSAMDIEEEYKRVKNKLENQ